MSSDAGAFILFALIAVGIYLRWVYSAKRNTKRIADKLDEILKRLDKKGQ